VRWDRSLFENRTTGAKEKTPMNAKLIFCVMCAAAATGLMGCDKKGSSNPPAGGTGSKSTSDMLKSAGEKVDEVAKQAKEKAVAAAQDVYDAAKKEYDALAAKVSASSSPEKPLWQKAVDGVNEQLEEAGKKLNELKAENSDWKKISEEISSLMTKAKDGIKSLASQVK
jgi:hypothetical protein